jgi:hypothetical protein
MEIKLGLWDELGRSRRVTDLRLKPYTHHSALLLTLSTKPSLALWRRFTPL